MARKSYPVMRVLDTDNNLLWEDTYYFKCPYRAGDFIMGDERKKYEINAVDVKADGTMTLNVREINAYKPKMSQL